MMAGRRDGDVWSSRYWIWEFLGFAKSGDGKLRRLTKSSRIFEPSESYYLMMVIDVLGTIGKGRGSEKKAEVTRKV